MIRTIDDSRKAVDEAQTALRGALEAHSAAVLDEASRLVAERDAKDKKLSEAREALAAIQARIQEQEQAREHAFVAYQRASFDGDEAAAKAAQRDGEKARKALQRLQKDEAKATRAVEEATYDEGGADEQLRIDLDTLANHVKAGITKDDMVREQIAIMFYPVEKRQQARLAAERIAEQDARRAEFDALPKGALLLDGSRKAR